jgi:hypothetical protein
MSHPFFNQDPLHGEFRFVTYHLTLEYFESDILVSRRICNVEWVPVGEANQFPFDKVSTGASLLSSENPKLSSEMSSETFSLDMCMFFLYHQQTID